MAAPIPVAKPERRPSAKVRLMVSTPMGPTGAAIEKPIMIPLRQSGVIVSGSIGRKVYGCYFVAHFRSNDLLARYNLCLDILQNKISAHFFLQCLYQNCNLCIFQYSLNILLV